MPQIKPEIETFAKIKVIGVGGSGGNAVSRMVNAKIKGVHFIAINTDAQDLHHTLASHKINIGKNITQGLGAGMNPEIGRLSAEENREEIQKSIEGADMIFITCGLGGGTGTGAAPVIADIAKDLGILTVAVVTTPFFFEGSQRRKIAEQGLSQLEEKVDTLIVIPNDKVLNVIDKKTTLTSAFLKIDDILRQGVQAISDLITLPGIINVDFADVKAVMQNSGLALIGTGIVSGEDRAIKAAELAINSPLLEVSANGAQSVLFNISGGLDLTMEEVNEAAKIINDSVASDAKIIFGALKDERLKRGEIKVTVVATKFNRSRSNHSNGLNGSNNNNNNKIVFDSTDELEEEDGWEIPAFIRRKNDKDKNKK